MNILKVFLAITIAISLTGCNATPKAEKLVKKTLVSDHYLLMSLLNRPIPADQQMMLAFAKQREVEYGAIFVNAVSIKGPKFIDNSNSLNTYSSLISNDVNSIGLQGPVSRANKI